MLLICSSPMDSTLLWHRCHAGPPPTEPEKAVLFGRHNHDFDQDARVRHHGLHAGAGRGSIFR